MTDEERRAAARGVAVGLLGVLGGFQMALAAGAPWGSAAYGGKHPGVLPTRLRVVSAAAVPVYGALFVLVAREPLGQRQRRAHEVVAGLFAAAVLLNLASPSRAERGWAPVCAAIATATLAARPARSTALARSTSAQSQSSSSEPRWPRGSISSTAMPVASASCSTMVRNTRMRNPARVRARRSRGRR